MGLKNATDIWQPVDGGYAMLLKRMINQAFFKWLDDDDNCEKWYGADSKFQAKEKRILVTIWVGTSYEKLCSTKYDSYRYRLFQKNGCLITADGSDDYKINPEGLFDYEVPPPSLLEASTNGPEHVPEPADVDGDRNIFDVLNDEICDDFEGGDEMDDVEIMDEDEEVNVDFNEVEEEGWVFGYLNSL